MSSKWHFRIPFLLLLLSLTLVQSASAYTVRSEHPRLYFAGAAGESTLVAKCKSAMSTEYAAMKADVDTWLTPDEYPLSSLDLYPTYMMMHGICNFVEGASDTTYFHEMKSMLTYVFAQADWEQQRYYLGALAIFYDWANAEIVTGGRDGFYGAKLDTALTWNTANYLTWHTTNNAHTKLWKFKELISGGIALAGDGHDDAAATAACDTFYNNVFGAPHAIAMIDSIARDGGYFEGDYSEDILKVFAEALYMFGTGCTDVSPFDSTSCLAGWGDYLVWDTWCDSGLPLEAYAFGASKQGDSNRHSGSRHRLRMLVNLLANVYDDANVMWLEDQFASHASAFNFSDEMWYIVLHDTLLSATSPIAAGWPIAQDWDVGTVHMRDGWDMATTSEDIWAVYRHEQYPFGHAHADAGHFTICRGQDLLLIPGGYYSPAHTLHRAEYQSQTIAHNTITIKKTGETMSGVTQNTGGQNFGEGIGQHPVTVGDYTSAMAGDDDRGSITDFSVVGDTLVYVRSDLTEAYADGKVDTVRREFVWLEPKDTFLIFDTVKTTGVSAGTLEQKQLFHMIPNPTTLTSAARWTEGDSTVKLTSLFGTGDVTITEVGGTGHHFDCNGTNYGNEETEYDEGDYRLELKPGQSDSVRWMLTAIQVTASADTSYSTLALVTTGGYIGAAVDSDTILFHKYGGAYTRSAGAAAAALGLDPQTLNFTYAEPDSHAMKFGISNTGGGILSWETTNICNWLSGSCVDTGTVGAGYDSVTVGVLWASVDSLAAWSDTVAVTGGGDGQVVVNVTGKQAAGDDDDGGMTGGHRRTSSRRR